MNNVAVSKLPIDQRLGDLIPTIGEGSSRMYTDSDFQQISSLLRDAGRLDWSNVPRIYTILRLINHLERLDSFIELGITDIWLPFTEKTLPESLKPSIRANFLRSQAVVLTKTLEFEKEFEKSSNRKHAHFSKGELIPFEVVGRLGTGASGTVDKVLSNLSHREYARKLFRRREISKQKEDITLFLTELRILKRITHIHCVELLGSYTDPKYFAILISPVADCNMAAYYDIAASSTDKLSLLRSFFGCLANALQYLHGEQIRHRDIKPANILVKGDRVFLTDFGISLDWQHLSRSTTTQDSGKTWAYAAPEVARNEPRNTFSDVWSLGCVFLEMATVLKGENVTEMQRYFKERNGDHRFYVNIKAMQDWNKKLQHEGSPQDNHPLKWASHMLREDLKLRPTALALYNEIKAMCASEKTPFCSPCCLDNESSDMSSGDDCFWVDDAETTRKARKWGMS